MSFGFYENRFIAKVFELLKTYIYISIIFKHYIIFTYSIRLRIHVSTVSWMPRLFIGTCSIGKSTVKRQIYGDQEVQLTLNKTTLETSYMVIRRRRSMFYFPNQLIVRNLVYLDARGR